MKTPKNESLTLVNKEFRATQHHRGKKVDRHGRVVTKNPKQDKQMNDFWVTIDKDALKDALCEAGDDRSLALATAIMNPKFRTQSMSKICRQYQITLQTLNDLWRKHNLTLGLINMASRLPKVMGDVAQDAESHYEVCPRCDGLGTISDQVASAPHAEGDKGGGPIEIERQCPKCKGAREIRVVGDKDARSLTFETMGLTGKSQGPLVAIQTNIGMDDTFEGVMSFAQKVIQKPQGDKSD